MENAVGDRELKQPKVYAGFWNQARQDEELLGTGFRVVRQDWLPLGFMHPEQDERGWPVGQGHPPRGRSGTVVCVVCMWGGIGRGSTDSE